MSDSIKVNPGNSGNDITVYYLGDNRQKRIDWAGLTDGTESASLNQLYSGLMDHFDESIQMDDGTPMSAQTPVEYTIGKIDSGDNEPWYVSYETMEFMTGGALQTTGWTRDLPGDGTGNIGIVVVACTGNDIDGTDIGDTITNTTNGDTGTLLDVIEAGTTDYLVIRPTSSALVNDWDSTSGTIDMTSSAHTATQSAAGVTGEQIWANLYSIGTIENDSHIYVYQGKIADDLKARKYSIADATQDWWGDGHIDICVPIRDFQVADNPIIDGGYLTVLARKFTTLYDNFEVSTSTTSGGRNPIPLATAPDLDNTTGYKQFTLSGATGNWIVGNEISGDTSNARAIITKVTNPGSTPTLEYYLIDDPQTDFNGTEAITNEDDTGAATGSGAVTAAGPALSTWFTSNTAPTIGAGGHTHVVFDTDDDGTDENYAVTIDCNANPLSEVYEWLKYISRRGNTATTDTDGIEAEQYIGVEAYLAWSGTVTGTIAEGADVTQANTGATGIIQSYYDSGGSGGYMTLRNIRGSFNTTDIVTDNDNSGTVTPNTTAVSFSPKKQSPFGTFAGGTFFGARAVLLTDWNSNDENSFLLTPAEGGTKSRPEAWSLSISNLIGTDETTITDDRVAAFRLTESGGDIDKTEYSSNGTGAIGGSSLVVDTAITTNTPGKATGGIVRIRDASNNYKEYRIRFASWDTSTFTLATINPSGLTTGTDTTTLVSTTDELDTVQRGDIVINTSQGNAVSYVTDVNAATNTVNIFPAITGQTSVDTVYINGLPIIMDTLDDAYVPLIDTYADSGSASVSLITDDNPIYFKAVARNVAHASPIKPFATTSAITSANVDIPVIRTDDTIYS